MKAIRVRYVENPRTGSEIKHSWTMIVKEKNPFFKWYKSSPYWEVLEEWEI